MTRGRGNAPQAGGAARRIHRQRLIQRRKLRDMPAPQRSAPVDQLKVESDPILRNKERGDRCGDRRLAKRSWLTWLFVNAREQWLDQRPNDRTVQ